MGPRLTRALASLAGVAVITWLATSMVPVNAATAGFVYLLLVLIIASTWGFVEAALASLFSTLCYNYFFFEPVGTFTITDPHNWVAVFSFLATALIAGRLSDKAKRRTLDALERQLEVERLYTFSRTMLLIDSSEAFPKQLAQKLADIFGLSAAVLYDRRANEFYRAGPSDFDGLDQQLRESALQGTTFADPARGRVIAAVRLGSEPIASLALQGPPMRDSVLQGIGNLVAIGLERARAQDLAHQVEAVRQSEQLRTALIDAMAHEFKTPLTSIKAATTSLLSSPEQPAASRMELLRVADEEAEHLTELIDNAVEMARLDTTHIDVRSEAAKLEDVVREAIESMRAGMDDRPLEMRFDERLPRVALDRRLIKLAVKQLVDNAVKYSAPGTPIRIGAALDDGAVHLDITNCGEDIPVLEQARIFRRFYRSPSAQNRIPGSGLGLSIAHRIVEAHHGGLTVTSGAGETTFRVTLPIDGVKA